MDCAPGDRVGPAERSGQPQVTAAPGYFRTERDRRRAAMREQFPSIAAAVDQIRARGCFVEVRHALEGPNEVGDPLEFAQAWDCPYSAELGRLFAQA